MHSLQIQNEVYYIPSNKIHILKSKLNVRSCKDAFTRTLKLIGLKSLDRAVQNSLTYLYALWLSLCFYYNILEILSSVDMSQL